MKVVNVSEAAPKNFILGRAVTKLSAHSVQHALDDIRNVHVYGNLDLWPASPPVFHVPLFPSRVLHGLALCEAFCNHSDLPIPPCEELGLNDCHECGGVVCKDGIYSIRLPAIPVASERWKLAVLLDVPLDAAQEY